MTKKEMILSLLDDLKDSIEFDTDIKAFSLLLLHLLPNHISDSLSYFYYFVSHYDIGTLKYNIDFTPLFCTYLEKLIDITSVEDYFHYLESISYEKQLVITSYLFSVHPSSYLFTIIKDGLEKKKYKQVEEMVLIIIGKEKYLSKRYFDLTTFLDFVIRTYLDVFKHSNDFLVSLTNVPTSKKERAVLKSLLIDYLS